jgi:amidase
LPDYIGATKKFADLTGVRIGVPRNGVSPQITFAPVNESYVLSAFDEALGVLASLGAEIVDPAHFSTETANEFIGTLSNDNKTVSLGISNETITIGADFITDIAAYMSDLTYNPNNITSVEDLRRYTQSDPREDYPDRDTGGWDAALALGFDASDLRAYNALQADMYLDESGGVTGTINKYNLTAPVLPTDYAPTWAASPGLPAVSVPMGAYPDGTPLIKGARELIAVAPGIPFGLAFLGKRWSEETLITLAYAFEQATRNRDKVVFSPMSTTPKTEIIDSLLG